MLHMENETYLFEMSNVRGSKVKNPHKLDFSFYFSTKRAIDNKDNVHGIRVKPIFNPETMNTGDVGTLQLHGNWEYIPGKQDEHISSKKIKDMKEFFKYYKTLFCAVWELELEQDVLYDYFRGIINFKELITEFNFYNKYKKDLDNISTLDELTEFIKNSNLFNLWDN